MTIQVETREPSPIRRELRIEVEAQRVSQELEETLDQVARQARLPGFRPGKVPRPLLRRRFAAQIENQLLENLVPKALQEALERTGLEPVHQPVIRDVALQDGEPLRFTAAFEILPVIEPRDYKGVVVRVPQARVEDEHVEQELRALRERAAEYEAVEPRPLAKGDHAVLDLRSLVEDGEAEPREHAKQLVEVGAEEYHPEFSASLLGMQPGETRSFRIDYGDEEPDPWARGKTVAYTVHCREIKRKVLPALDDDFARDVGKESLAELRSLLRSDLEKRLERERRTHEERQLMEALVTGLQAEIPQALVERELERMLTDQARLLAARGIDPRTAPIDWRATANKLREPAVRNVRWELLLLAIARKEGIEVRDEDVERRIERIAEGSGRSVAYVRSKIEKEKGMSGLKTGIRLERTVDFLLANARIEGVSRG